MGGLQYTKLALGLQTLRPGGAREGLRRPDELESEAMSIDVCAHITGTVWKIEVSEGEQVELDQLLLTLESMKMEMPIVAPQAGRVQRIAVEPGQGVEEDDLLLTLE